jgi:hypothetical protein
MFYHLIFVYVINYIDNYLLYIFILHRTYGLSPLYSHWTKTANLPLLITCPQQYMLQQIYGTWFMIKSMWPERYTYEGRVLTLVSSQWCHHPSYVQHSIKYFYILIIFHLTSNGFLLFHFFHVPLYPWSMQWRNAPHCDLRQEAKCPTTTRGLFFYENFVHRTLIKRGFVHGTSSWSI